MNCVVRVPVHNPADPPLIYPANMKNGCFQIVPGVQVAMTYAGLYYVGRAVVNKLASRKPRLYSLTVLDIDEKQFGNLELPFPDGDKHTLCECVGRSVLWEACYLRPYAPIPEEAIGGPPIDYPEAKPIDWFLKIKIDDEVLLLIDDNVAAVGSVEEISPNGSWSDFDVPHSFYLVVRLKSVLPNFGSRQIQCEVPSLNTLEKCIGLRVLWSGYNVRPVDSQDPQCHSSQGSCIPNDIPFEDEPIHPNEIIDDSDDASQRTSSGDRGSARADEDILQSDASESSDRSGSENVPPQWNRLPDRSQWRNELCELLNSDLSVYAVARIRMCLPGEAMDDNLLGDDDVGVLVVDKNCPIHMSLLRWPLRQTRLLNGRVLADIVQLRAENMMSSSEDELIGIPKAPYRCVRRKKSHDPKASKFQRMTSDEAIRKVSSQKCCILRCCQTFDWESTLRVRQKFHSASFDQRREMAYAVQSQLHSLPGKSKRKFITIESTDVCENAWYIIHGVSRASYHNYKKAARSGSITSSHGNSGQLRPRPATVQAEGTIHAIVRMNADLMPHQMKGIGGGRQDVRQVLPSTLNWKQVLSDVNEVCFSIRLYLHTSIVLYRRPADTALLMHFFYFCFMHDLVLPSSVFCRPLSLILPYGFPGES